MPSPNQALSQRECRGFTVDSIKVEQRSEGVAALIQGHAAVFDQLSEDLGGFRERIAPGAFAKTIQKLDQRALWNHNTDYVLGRRGAGTLRLREDSKGLAIEIDPPDTQYARDLMVSMQRGDVDQMSFAFATISDRWDKVDGEWIRTLLEVDLFEVSPVTFPAYSQTDVSARALDGFAAARASEQPPADHDLALRRMRLDLVEAEL
ncbi:HK97 family phage prohead protease [Chitinibacter fontanus]|uniref:HK97 family phage prohead protease n=1 Tax=Chitinibacter fontanus TaxID=1737446 RepID=A0A7D5Z1L8_9NEIS|nr:HK97 family phage prohead protease [Chitinibacter fontanus]QLI80801.1 HK97 family phage prohead protease [Chitinibacter fontanus]